MASTIGVTALRLSSALWSWQDPSLARELFHMLPIQMLYRGLRLNPNGEAVVHGELRLTYQQLVVMVDAFASYLQDRLPVPQSRVGLCAHNNWQHLVAMLAVFASGHVWVPLNPRNSAAELVGIAKVAELSL